jgi:hypothetical protein
MNPSVKRAGAYLRAEKIYFHPDSRTVKGFWIACEPIVVTSENDKSLGEQILHVLAQSTQNVPDPESLVNSDTWDVTKKLVKAAGVRSYEAFADSTQCVGMMLDDKELALTPTRNGGYRKRFLYLKATIRCQPIAAEAAAALMAAFEACE